MLLPKGWPRPEILSVKADNRPSEPDLVNSGVGIGDVLQGCLIGAIMSKKFTILLILSVTFFCTPVRSEDWIEEVIVRGDFRDTVIAEVSSSVALIDPQSALATVNHLEEVIGRAANVNYASGSSRARYFQIRGVGERGQFIEPINPSVGLIFDGVDLSGVGTVANLFDVGQVEILRGPQGTVYGANSLAGTINILSNDPTEQFLGFVEAEVGEYAARGLGLVLSGPINSKSGLRLSAKHYQQDGFIENVHLGVRDTNAKDERSIRLKYVIENNDSIYRINLGRLEVNNGYDAFSLDNNRETLSDEPGMDDQDTTIFSVSINKDLADDLGLAFSAGLGKSDISYGYDEDWTFVGFDPWEYSSKDLYERKVDSLSYQLRLMSQGENNSKKTSFDWVAGIYGYHHDLDLMRSYTYLTEGFTSSYEVDRFAVFGEISKKVVSDWVIRVGLRGEYLGMDYLDSSTLQYDPDDFLVGGRVLVERNLNPDRLVYFGMHRGYKSGGFNTDGSIDEDLRLFSSEGLWNFEIGYKGSFFDERLHMRAAIFRMKRNDIQIATSIVRERSDGSSEFIEYTGNAAEGFNQGLEFDLRLRAADRLFVDLSAGWLDTNFSSYQGYGERVLAGRDQAHAPNYQFHAGAEYVLSSRWAFHLELEAKDSFFYSDSHDFESNSYELINLGLSFQGDRWEAKVWLKNVMDKEYYVRGYFFGNDPRQFYEPNLWTQLGYPRYYGLSLRASF